MTTLVKTWLDNAILQSVAESYLDLLPRFGTDNLSLDFVLSQGVNHPKLNPNGEGATRLTDTQITWFDANYRIVSHYPSDASGFSASLFQNKATGEYTLSFRSTEYATGAIDHAQDSSLPDLGGDWARDGADAADGDISKYGFALGQLSAMEKFYQSLKSGETPLLPEGAVLNVTGYSLGGHLSTAFTLLHESEVKSTLNINAAGLGGMSMVGGATRAPNKADLMQLIQLYNDMMSWDGQGDAWLSSVIPNSTAEERNAFIDAARVHPGALGDMESIYLSNKHKTAMILIGKLTTGAGVGDSQDGVLGGLGTRRLIDAVESWAASTGNGPLDHDVNEFSSNLFGASLSSKITQINGHGEFFDPEMVANGGYHPANPQGVWIEDLPASRGLGILEAASTNIRPYVGDFGETHSITPLIDSLTVMDLLQKLDPGLDRAKYTSIMKAVSNRTDVLPYEASDWIGAAKTIIDARMLPIIGPAAAAAVLAQAATGNRLYDADALENMVNALSLIFTGESPELVPDIDATGYANLEHREKLHQAIENIRSTDTFKAAQGQLKLTSLADISYSDIHAKAILDTPEGAAYRYALQHLNPFVISGSESLYADHNELELYDAETGAGAMTEQYLSDRAKFLGWKLTFASGRRDDDDIVTSVGDKPYSEDWDTNSIKTGDWIFKDFNNLIDGKPLKLNIDGTSNQAIDPTHYVLFGSESAGNPDMLQGGDESDYLYGMGGADDLDGGEGNDYLEGGQGFDTYIIGAAQGADTILDSDGQGKVKFEGVDLSAVVGKLQGPNLWKTQNGDITFLKFTEANGSSTLRISGKQGGSALIKNFKEGNLGIRLETETQVDPSPQSNRLILGDLEPKDFGSEPGVQTRQDELGNIITDPGKPSVDRVDTLYDSAGNDTIQSRGGNDIIQAERGGNDSIDSGAGRDSVNGGAGDDYIIAGEDGDIVSGATGQDRIYGTAFIGLGEAIAKGNTPIGTGKQGDWLAGGDDNDQLIGGADNDVLSGGAGDDILIAGAGDDDILGDTDWVATSFEWTVTDTDKGRLFQPVTGRHVEEEGSDIIYAGSGNDHVWADVGNDVVFGELGDDMLQGNGGNDLLMGGAGKDRIYGDKAPYEGADVVPGNDWLDGGDDDDRLYGEERDDTIYGGSGDDHILGDRTVDEGGDPSEDGDDYIEGGTGNDTIAGGGRDDVVLGGAGMDTLFGDNSENYTLAEYHGQDYLDGGDDDDVLYGNGGDDTLVGGAGNDKLYGGMGHDVLIGGAGADSLYGGDGDDVYQDVSEEDVIGDTEGKNRIVLTDAVGIASSGGLNVSGQGAVLSLTVDTGKTITLKNALFGMQASLEFANRRKVDLETLVSEKLRTAVSLQLSDEGGRVYGGAMADTLLGGKGDDVLTGHRGNDTLRGAGGSDTYLYNLGDGRDVIVEYSDTGTDKVDVLRFGEGIAASDIRLSRTFRNTTYLQNNGDDGLLLNILANGGGEVYIPAYFFSADSATRIDRVEFSDGTIWTYENILDRVQNDATERNDSNLIGLAGDDIIDSLAGNDYINGRAGADRLLGGTGDDWLEGSRGNDSLYGGDGDDTLFGNEYSYNNSSPNELGNDSLDGGVGDDTLIGGRGDDIYIFDRGYGWDTVEEMANENGSSSDVVRLGKGVLPEHVTLFRSSAGSPADLILVLDNSNTQLVIKNYFSDTDTQVERIEFDAGNGPVWVAKDIIDHVVVGQINQFTGTTSDDVYIVDDTRDVITEAANSGKDTVLASRNYTLSSNLENLTFTGLLNSEGIGNELDNTFIGNSGDNVFYGMKGIDTAYGGKGNDKYFEIEKAVELNGEGNDTLYSEDGGLLPDNIENLVVNRNNGITYYYNTRIVLGGNGLNNTLIYDRSNPGFSAGWITSAAIEYVVYDGGGGADLMIHNSTGPASFHVDNIGDKIILSSARGGPYTVISTIDYVLGDNFDDLSLKGALATNGWGNARNNILEGIDSSAANKLFGGLGNDTYYLGSGDHAFEETDAGFDRVVIYQGTKLSYSITDFANIEELELRDQLGDVNLEGGLNGDVLIGNNVRNRISGGAGADTMNGGNGDDTYVVDNVLDLVRETDSSIYGGRDVIESFVTYTLPQNVEKLVLMGAANIDAFGNTASNSLEGNAGDNLLYGGGGGDYLAGGAGSDRYLVKTGERVTIHETDAANSSDVLQFDAGLHPSDFKVYRWGNSLIVEQSGDMTWVQLENWFKESSDYYRVSRVEFADGTLWTRAQLTSKALVDLVGTEETDFLEGADGYADRLVGLGGADLLHGRAGNDTLEGGAGNDRLYGDEGADFMVGAVGDDEYEVDNASDNVLELVGEGSDSVRSTVSWVLPQNVENLYLDGSFAIKATGNAENNHLFGNSADNVLDGKGGADEMIGGLGNDTYVIDSLADVVLEYANGGIDTIQTDLSLTLATNVENLVLTGTAAINGIGNALNNTLTGNSAANTLNGGAGVDTLKGGAGNDTYVLDNTGDIVVELANQGDDLVQSSVSYTLSAQLERLTLTGSGSINATGNELNNTLIGNMGVNVLAGGAGNDTLDGYYGADTLQGGLGNDIYVVDDSDTVIEKAGEGDDTVQSRKTYTLTDNVENLVLTGDLLANGTGNALNNRLTGNLTANTLDGGAGADAMAGGAGNDTYIVDNAGDTIVELANEGTDFVQSSISYTLVANVERLTLTGTAAINGIGNAMDNGLTGNAAANVLDGGLGIDTLSGGLGDDTYIVDNASDWIREDANAGNDTVQTHIGFTLLANLENLTLTGSAAVNGKGNELNNRIIGNAAANTLDGGAGADTLVGGAGNDIYVVDNTLDVVNELANGGIDTIQSSVNYTLGADQENLTLTGTAIINGAGNALDNIITGNNSDNQLTGGAGNDFIDGAGGADKMAGGIGDDTYVVNLLTDTVTENANEGTDTVRASFNYTLGANVENLTLTGSSAINGTGNALNNILIGNAAANKLNGGAGADTMKGGAGNDVYTVDHVSDVVTELSGEGVDTVQSSITHTLSANVENLTLTGTGAINGTGNLLNNLLIGNAGINVLNGASGNDLLQGLAGNDALTDSSGKNLFDGGAGNDALTGGAGNELFIGGTGDDAIVLGGGSNVLAFNTGDGKDIVTTVGGANNTLSLGRGIRYADLKLSKSGNNLILSTGGTDQITFKDWYASTSNQTIAKLQVIAESMADFNDTGSDKIRDDKVETFNLAGLVGRFDAARMTNSSLTSWSMTSALLDFHLAGSDVDAVGGDLAYQYGMAGKLAGIGLNSAQSVISATTFGQSTQTLNASTTWQAETVKLG